MCKPLRIRLFSAPLTKRHWLTAATSQGETQLAQDDMMEQLRKELERAAKGQGGANNPAPPAPGGAPNPNSSRGAAQRCGIRRGARQKARPQIETTNRENARRGR